MTLLRLLGRGVRRPRLVAAGLRAAWRFRARRWWLRPPFLPLPPRAYLDWRLDTAYGDTGEPTGEEMERYVLWANRMHAGRQSAGRTP
jgi:hypothetical protein